MCVEPGTGQPQKNDLVIVCHVFVIWIAHFCSCVDYLSSKTFVSFIFITLVCFPCALWSIEVFCLRFAQVFPPGSLKCFIFLNSVSCATFAHGSGYQWMLVSQLLDQLPVAVVAGCWLLVAG